MRTKLYTVTTQAGITFHVEALDECQARQRAHSPELADHLANLIRAAVRNVTRIEPHHGPRHTARYPLFDEEFFSG